MALASPSFFFAVLATLVITTKIIHIYANSKALAQKHLLLWGYSFFAQDLVLLAAFRSLFASSLYTTRRRRQCFSSLASWIVTLLAVYTALVSFAGICFFTFNGSEIHYRNLDFAKDASARAVLLSGLLTGAIVAIATVTFSWLAQTPIYFVFGLPADAITFGWSACRPFLARSFLSGKGSFVSYQPVSQNSSVSEKLLDDLDTNESEATAMSQWKRAAWYLASVASVAALLVEAGFLIFRPAESSLTYLSWTAPILPFIDFDNSSPSLQRLAPVYDSGIGNAWDETSALGKPPKFPWLRQEPELPGFEDWYREDAKHYNAAQDPLKANDQLQGLLPGLREHLKGLKIRHVVVLMLESTRKDLFPVKKDGLIWNRFAETYPDRKLSPEAVERLATLTPTANYLTGDYEDGFDHAQNKKKKGRGGISFDNAYTSGTFTLKSTVGTLCGVHPLIADFNLEYQHHIYQPCLPHILEALNSIEDKGRKHGFSADKWRSSFLQSSTIDYDNTGPLLQAIGFPKNQTIAKEYLKRPDAKFGKVTLPDINYFGIAEYPLRDYIRDAFVTAKKNHERVFLTHITSTSHHPYNMPANETYVPLGYEDALSDMSHYVNAVGYDDRWISQIFDVLDQEGVADETLVVLHGDHGLSIPENDILASYYNPNVGCDHVPLVFSHPKLPPMQINTPVSTVQILPTILDLLVESKSLSHKKARAAQDLRENFEGTSLLRGAKGTDQPAKGGDQKKEESSYSQNVGKWQFVVMNPGRAMVGVRHADHKDWRLVVPVLANVVWRFTDISADPREQHPTVNFDFRHLLATVEKEHGVEAAKWVEEAAFVARWWVEENSKRWQYGQYASSQAS
ncbi:hypothetical protein NLU13_2580 [Sarocladium strictum]|uniref:Sulfatase N-terminal domain-containing protein n=1 Tax=Sarocladium strictum TaxID=5046 RepID=A0AA39GKE8_SARSR|nr:hypothetical protein NLU13_2580 [Sarocladium strictum]